MNNDFNYLVSLWKNYNNASLLLIKAMNGTANEVGEFAEKLVCKYFNVEQLNASNKSADLITKEGKLIQVKSRKIEQLISTSLNVIRSWDFDILIVILFSKDGNILKSIQIDSITAKKLSKYNKHQNGYILTTSKELLENENAIDITVDLQNILNGDNVVKKENNQNYLSKDEKKIENIVGENIIHTNDSRDIVIKNIVIPKFNNKYEKLQDYIKKVLHLLFDNNLLPDAEILKLQDIEYCKETFYLYYPLLEMDYRKTNDANGYLRYWKKLFGNKYYVCKEWWKQNVDIYYNKFYKWLKYISKIN